MFRRAAWAAIFGWLVGAITVYADIQILQFRLFRLVEITKITVSNGFYAFVEKTSIDDDSVCSVDYLLRYAKESSWREDNRRVPNGDQVSRVAGLAMKQKPSMGFQRLLAAA